mmetsp:Transcript_30214/g.92426  ORF Transcript_30214/g.92426 Transcript_30214/m.92426 type:complete len:523 (-) Transcript_30214:167-1735(-)
MEGLGEGEAGQVLAEAEDGEDVVAGVVHVGQEDGVALRTRHAAGAVALVMSKTAGDEAGSEPPRDEVVDVGAARGAAAVGGAVSVWVRVCHRTHVAARSLTLAEVSVTDHHRSGGHLVGRCFRRRRGGRRSLERNLLKEAATVERDALRNQDRRPWGEGGRVRFVQRAPVRSHGAGRRVRGVLEFHVVTRRRLARPRPAREEHRADSHDVQRLVGRLVREAERDVVTDDAGDVVVSIKDLARVVELEVRARRDELEPTRQRHGRGVEGQRRAVVATLLVPSRQKRLFVVVFLFDDEDDVSVQHWAAAGVGVVRQHRRRRCVQVRRKVVQRLRCQRVEVARDRRHRQKVASEVAELWRRNKVTSGGVELESSEPRCDANAHHRVVVQRRVVKVKRHAFDDRSVDAQRRRVVVRGFFERRHDARRVLRKDVVRGVVGGRVVLHCVDTNGQPVHVSQTRDRRRVVLARHRQEAGVQRVHEVRQRTRRRRRRSGRQRRRHARHGDPSNARQQRQLHDHVCRDDLAQ